MTWVAVVGCALVVAVYFTTLAVTRYVIDGASGSTHGLTDQERMKLQAVVAVRVMAEACLAIGALALTAANIVELGDSVKNVVKVAGVTISSPEANVVVVFTSTVLVFVALCQRSAISALVVSRLREALRQSEREALTHSGELPVVEAANPAESPITGPSYTGSAPPRKTPPTKRKR